MHSSSSLSDWFESRAFDADISRQYEAVVDEGLALIDRSDRDTLVITGDDTVSWLQGLVTSDLHDLVDEGRGQRTAMVNTTGRFVGEARILHLPQMLLLDLESGLLDDGLLSHLQQHIILESVNLYDRSEATARIGVYGRRAAALLATLDGWTTNPRDLDPFCGAWTRWRGEDLIVQRTPWIKPPGLELICALDVAPALLDFLESSFAESRLPAFQDPAFEVLRLEAGVPRMGTELGPRVIPLEAGFEGDIAYDKGCYLGQEIIARLDTLGTPAKKLRQVILDSPIAPEAGADVFPEDGEGRSIGTVKSAVFSPEFGAAIALAFIKRDHNAIGHTVRINDHLGTLAPLMDVYRPGTPLGADASIA